MFKKKLKSKFNRKFRSFFAVVALLTIVGGFFSIPKAIAADANGTQTFKVNDINLGVDTYINGASTPDNYARIGLDSSAKLTVRVVVKVASANACTDDGSKCDQTTSATHVHFGTDKIFFKGVNQTLLGAAVGLRNKNDITGDDGTVYNCFQDKKRDWTLLGFSTAATYMNCNFPSGLSAESQNNGASDKDVAVGGVVFDKTFTITQSNLKNLGLTTASQNQSNIIYAYPGISYSGDNDVINQGGGLGIYVDTYDTQANADQANKTQSKPSSVPGYGNVTSNAQSQQKGLAGSIADLIAQIIGAIVALLQEFIFYVFSYLILPLLVAMLGIRTYTDIFVGVIYPGWVIVRNACNILFILAIMAIAMGTLFRVDSYQYKHLLVQEIVAALLVNFSLVIGQAVLALADTVQNQFLPNSPAVVKSLANLMIVNNVSSQQLGQAMQNTGSSFANVIVPLFALAFSIGTFIVFVSLVGFLSVRVVMLWMFLMISPIAYVAGVLPITAHYRMDWWKNFIKYAFFTPVIAFFLNIAATLALAQTSNPVLKNMSDLVTKDPTLNQNPNITTFVFKIGGNIMLLIFLFAALEIANRLGIAGGSVVSEWGKKGMMLPFQAAGGAVKGVSGIAGNYAGRRYNELTSKIRGHDDKVPFWRAAAFAAVNPVAFVKGMKKQSEERRHRAEAKAEATGLEVAEQRFSTFNPMNKAFWRGSYKRNPHVLQHEKEEEDEQAKKLQNLSREEVARRVHQFFMLGDSEEEMAYKRGGYKLAMTKGYVDDIVGLAYNDEEGREMIKKMINENWLHVGEGATLEEKYDTSDLEEVTVDPTTQERKVTGNKVIKKDDGTFWARDGLTGQEHEVSEDDLSLVANNHSTRRALQLALFGGKMNRKEQKGFYVTQGDHAGEFYEAETARDPSDVAGVNVVDNYAIGDHAAQRLITQEGETEGRSTRHWEYMTDMKADSQSGHFTSYALRKVYDVDGKKFMYVSDGERQMSAGELAKEEGRQGARIAPHAIMSMDGQHFSRANYAVWSKLAVANPGFLPERNANFFVTGNSSAISPEVERNKHSFETDATLHLENPNFGKNLKIMWNENREAAKIVLSKFSGIDVKNIDDHIRAHGGLKIYHGNGGAADVEIIDLQPPPAPARTP